ncbi:MAG: transporter substrate-binding domain-containing protein [Acetobacteraceae bacterium]
MSLFRAALIAALILLSGAGPLLAQPSQPTQVKAVIYVAPPFVQKAADGYTGFTWDLWRQIADDLNLTYELQTANTVADALRLVREGKVDIAVADLSITADRFQVMDFSQPYFDAGLRIMIDEDRHASLRNLIGDLRQGGHLRVYAWIGVFILIGTIVLTLVDRRWHPEFPHEWGSGLAESFYHVMSVATSGSTSHRNLFGAFGTALGALWLACGVAVVAYITSSITSVMTASTIAHQINGPADLGGKRVGALIGSVGESYCRAAMLDVQSFDTMEQAVEALLKGQVTAIVRDAPVLEWFDTAHPELPVTVVGPVFKAEKYGFALPSGSPLTRPVSEAILRLKDSGALEALRMRYFGSTR